MKDAFKIKRSLQYESLVDRSTKSKLEKKAFFALWFLYYCCGGEGLKRHGFVVGRAFFPYEGTDYKGTPFDNDAEAKLSRKGWETKF